jgi:plastocyanin
MKNLIGSKSRLLTGVSVLLVALSLSSGCSKSSNDYGTNNGGNNDTPGINEVWMKGMAFTPSSITVAAGTTITWTNKDNVTHNVTSNDGRFTNSPSMASGAVYSFKFDTKGTYGYICSIHPTMTGTVTVN